MKAAIKKTLKNSKAIYTQKLSCKQFACEEIIPMSNPITCAKDAQKIGYALWDQDEIAYSESGYALYLNRSNKPICWALISKGSIAGTIFDSRIILSHGLLCGASSIILFHNHPSGNVSPSEADLLLTRKVKEQFKLMEMPLLDHIIITPDQNKFTSLGDEGLI